MQTGGRITELEAEVAALRAQLAAHVRSDQGDPVGFLGALLEAVPAFILRADPDLRLRYINRLQPGMTRHDVIGRSMWDFVAPDDLGEARRCVKQVLETGVGAVYETVSVGPHGGTAPYQVFVEAIDEPDGRRGICMVAVDLSMARRRERALQESDEKLRLAVAATGIGLWSWSPRTGELEWDARMREILGRDIPLDLPAYLTEAVHRASPVPAAAAAAREHGRRRSIESFAPTGRSDGCSSAG
jgi:PAS domain S-box-containing protein